MRSRALRSGRGGPSQKRLADVAPLRGNAASSELTLVPAKQESYLCQRLQPRLERRHGLSFP